MLMKRMAHIGLDFILSGLVKLYLDMSWQFFKKHFIMPELVLYRAINIFCHIFCSFCKTWFLFFFSFLLSSVHITTAILSRITSSEPIDFH